MPVDEGKTKKQVHRLSLEAEIHKAVKQYLPKRKQGYFMGDIRRMLVQRDHEDEKIWLVRCNDAVLGAVVGREHEAETTLDAMVQRAFDKQCMYPVCTSMDQYRTKFYWRVEEVSVLNATETSDENS